MTDIITWAKRLLENSTPGPWVAADSDILKESNGEFIGTISEYSGIDYDSEESANTRLAAAAPELAAALAQETWEYRVMVKGNSPGLEVRTFDSLEAAQKEYGYQQGLCLAGVRSRPTPIEVRRVTEWKVIK